MTFGSGLKRTTMKLEMFYKVKADRREGTAVGGEGNRDIRAGN